jgi:hypothetical protein
VNDNPARDAMALAHEEPGSPSPPDRRRRPARWWLAAMVAAALGTTLGVAVTGGSAQATSTGIGFLSHFQNVVRGQSTAPADEDLNPYGVAVVPQSTGDLVQGGVLVSNFNDAANAQGTGTTIVQQKPDGTITQFAQINQVSPTGPCPGGIGLTTALSILPGGWVVVGSLPTSANGPADQGMPSGIGTGCLTVLNSQGQVVQTLAGGDINGPWDMTAVTFGDDAYLFVTNVLNGITANPPGTVVNQGTVVRIKLELHRDASPTVVSQSVIASGFSEHTDPVALIAGPTGDALGWNGTLYVADSVNSRIAGIPNALFRDNTFPVPGGFTVSASSALDDPLGMALAPDGDLLTVNGNNGLIVETSPFGQTVNTASIDDAGSPPGAGNLFGLAVAPGGRGIWFVDDGTNTLNLFF